MSSPILYGVEMVQRVERMHAGAEQLPGYAGWIADHLGGRVVAFRQRLIPQILAFTDLQGLEVLDFGCGTGSSTVALWERAKDCSFTALDVDRDGLEIARLRFRHHGIEDRVDLHAIEPVQRVGDLPFANATFDFVLANALGPFIEYLCLKKPR